VQVRGRQGGVPQATSVPAHAPHGVAAGAGSAPNGEGGGGRRKGAASYQEQAINPSLQNKTHE